MGKHGRYAGREPLNLFDDVSRGLKLTTKVTIIGDQFMQATAFQAALLECIDQPLDCTIHDLPFPELPVVQTSDLVELSNIKEFQGEPDEIVRLAASAEAIITHIAPITRAMLDQLPELKFVGVARGGPVNVDRQALKERNIVVVNTPGRNASAVAEFTIGALISESRNIAKGHSALSDGVWRGDLYRADVQRKELSKMTVGIVGYAHIGKRVGQLLKAFGARILVSDPYISLDNADIKYGIKNVELSELLAKSDAVTLHLPATPETDQLFNARTFEKMKRGAVFINTSRGSLVDEQALVNALNSGRLSGAALDTYQTEPLPVHSPLTTMPNVLLTPHIAGASTTTVNIAACMIAEELKRYLAGEPPVNAC